MDLRRLLAIGRAWLPLLIGSLLLAGGAAFAISSLQQSVYEAKATLMVGQSLSAANPDYAQILVSQRLSTTYARVATTRPVLEAVISKLQLGVTPDDLLGRVRAAVPQDSTLLTITAQDADPARAAAIANELAAQLIAASPTILGRQAEARGTFDAQLRATEDQIQTTQDRVDALAALPTLTPQQQADLQSLESRLVTLRSTYATLLSLPTSEASNLLTIVEPAVPPDSPVSPKVLLNTLVAALLGLLVVAGLVALVEYLDESVKDAVAVREVLDLGTLGTIGEMPGDRGRSELYRLVTLLNPHSVAAEAYRVLRTNVEFASRGAPPRSLLITSSSPREGKTVTAANLAVVFAQAGYRVLLVDADLRRPSVHLLFDLPNAHGLTSLVRSESATLDWASHETEQENLRILTTGPLPENPAELLRSPEMRAVFDRLCADAQLVIFDSPPLRAVTDPAILSSLVDATLFVIDAGHARRRAVVQGREALNRVDARVLGAILNRVPTRVGADEVAYYSGYDRSGEGPPKKGQGTSKAPERGTSKAPERAPS